MSEREPLLKMILTAVGPDRPGLVKAISSVVHQAGGNLEDSRMAQLAGDFALLVLFSGTSAVADKIAKGAKAIATETGLEISMRRATPSPGGRDAQVWELEAMGADQPGIVHRLSTIFAENKANVRSLDSRLVPAAFSGTPLFRIRALIELPQTEPVDVLKSSLAEACAALHLTLDLHLASDD